MTTKNKMIKYTHYIDRQRLITEENVVPYRKASETLKLIFNLKVN